MIFRAAARTKTERLVSTMKKTYKIEVDCANCAQKMEDAANTVAEMCIRDRAIFSGNNIFYSQFRQGCGPAGIAFSRSGGRGG